MGPVIFIELSKILLVTLVVTGFIRLLKQPPIIGYILSGILVGPFFFNVLNSVQTFSVFSHIGVALLLFFVGLNLNPKLIKDVGKVSLFTGLGQVILTSGVGFLIIRYLLGFNLVASLYIAIALAFSSTIIIMKLLSDKKEVESLHGRISIGFLIVQDLIAIILLLVISSVNQSVDATSLAINTIIKGVFSIGILFLLTIYILPKITKVIAKSQEYLLLFSLSWCFLIASVFHYLNFSIEAGALIAGVTLSLSPYHFEISAKLKPLRDFFLILFFVMLGAQMVFANLLENIVPIILLSLFVLIGNPIIVMFIMGRLNYTKRNSFLSGLAVAQISEFSLIVVTLGLTVGHVSNEILSLVTTIGLITFAGSTYLILYSHKIYPVISKYLSIFERSGRKVDEQKYHKIDVHDIILFGYNRVGVDILHSLKKIKKKFLIIDFDPDVIYNLSKQGYDCRYGDANDLELLNELNFAKAKMVISTVPDLDTNLLLIKKIKEQNKNAIVSVLSQNIDDAVKLYDYGATYVLMPHFLGAKHFSTMLEKNKLSVDKFLEEKISHLEHIKYRTNMREKHHTHRKKEV